MVKITSTPIDTNRLADFGIGDEDVVACLVMIAGGGENSQELRRDLHDFEGGLQVLDIAIKQWRDKIPESEQRERKKLDQLQDRVGKIRDIKRKYFDSVFTQDLLTKLES